MKQRFWYGLLLLPFIATLWPPFFNRTDPTLAGFPFFYWYLIAWIVFSSLVIWIVMLLTNRGDRV
jgi:Protein of unknown function (DUF3311)